MKRLLLALACLASCSDGTASEAPSTADTAAGEDSQIADTSAAVDTAVAMTDTGTATDTIVTSDVAPDAGAYGPYPAGPYGTKVGQTLAPLDWVGYVNLKGDETSTKKMYGPTSLDALRRTGKGYGIVHLSEFG